MSINPTSCPYKYLSKKIGKKIRVFLEYNDVVFSHFTWMMGKNSSLRIEDWSIKYFRFEVASLFSEEKELPFSPFYRCYYCIRILFIWNINISLWN